MRKLLLGTTALAAAVTLSANVATADVTSASDVAISGYFEWDYSNVNSDITGNDGTAFGQDSEVKMVFTNKTDSGLTVAFTTEFETDKAGGGTSDDNYLSISGGFGKLVLGELDGVMDQYGISASDLPAEEMYVGEPADMVTENADGVAGAESNKISYHLPAMGGLTAGVSYTNSGVTGATDVTSYAAKYVLDAGGATISIAAGTGTAEVSGAQDADTQVMGVAIASGDLKLNVSNATYEDADQDESTNGLAVSFGMASGTTLVGYTSKLEDDTSNEEYSVSGVEVQYTIASGLSAVITVEDYEYEDGTTGTASDDSGTASSITIKASF